MIDKNWDMFKMDMDILNYILRINLKSSFCIVKFEVCRACSANILRLLYPDFLGTGSRFAKLIFGGNNETLVHVMRPSSLRTAGSTQRNP